MDKIVGVISTAPKTRSKNDDDFADRLSSRYTVVLLIAFAVLVGIIEVRSSHPAPSLGWGPRGQGPQQKSSGQGPGKNNWTDHVPSGLPDKNFGILGHFWY